MENKPKISQEELELIERFWQGKFVDNSEESHLQERYIHEEAWRIKADEVRLLMLGIQESVLEEKLDDFHRAIESPSTGWQKWAVAACTIGFFIAVGLFLFSKTHEEKLFARYYTPDPGLPTFMGISDRYEFENAMVDYKMGDYKKAAESWKALLGESISNDTLQYFIGSAYLAQGMADAAIISFSQVVADPESAFASEAYWYLSLAWIKMKDPKKALEALQHTQNADKESLLKEINP